MAHHNLSSVIVGMSLTELYDCVRPICHRADALAINRFRNSPVSNQ